MVIRFLNFVFMHLNYQVQQFVSLLKYSAYISSLIIILLAHAMMNKYNEEKLALETIAKQIIV